MKLRRLCALLLSFAMLLSLLSGCGGKESEEGGLIDEDGDTLFPTELPDFTPVAYFEEGGYSFDLEMDEGMLFPSDAQVSRMRSWRLRPIICKSCWNCPQREANDLPSAFFRTVRCCL